MCLSQCLSGYEVLTQYPVWSFFNDVCKTPSTMFGGGRELFKIKLTFPHSHKALHSKAVVIWQCFKLFVLDTDWNHNSMISLLQAYLIGTFRVPKFLGLQDHILLFIPLQLCGMTFTVHRYCQRAWITTLWHHKSLPQ